MKINVAAKTTVIPSTPCITDIMAKIFSRVGSSVDLARSKVICDLIKNGEIKKQYSTTIDMDKTIVEFKLRMRDYICVYLSDEFEEENHFIDLEFLNEEIDINKFK